MSWLKSHVYEYAYDYLERLNTSRVMNHPSWWVHSVGDSITSTYDYELIGNRVYHRSRFTSGGGPAQIGYAHDKANRMTTIDSLSQGYDLAGNQTVGYSLDRGTSYTYRYDHQNRLTGVFDSTNSTRKAAYTYDAMGRRIEHVNDVTGDTIRYYYDGVNEIVDYDGAGNRSRFYVQGVSYVDERLMMLKENGAGSTDDRPYYYALDRQYSVRALVDRAGAIVETYFYDDYGRPFIRESAGRGDMTNDTDIGSTDNTRFFDEINNNIWDPRADMNDDGSVTLLGDSTAFNTAKNTWTELQPTVAQAFSDQDNPFMFQGRPHYALDSASNATEPKLCLNDHRARMNDPVIGRWLTKDPAGYVDGNSLYEFLLSGPTQTLDPSGFAILLVGGLGGIGDTDLAVLGLRLAQDEYNWNSTFRGIGCTSYLNQRGMNRSSVALISSPTGPGFIAWLLPDWSGARDKIRQQISIYENYRLKLENDCGCPEILHIVGFSDGASSIAYWLKSGHPGLRNAMGLVATLDLVRKPVPLDAPSADMPPREYPDVPAGAGTEHVNIHNIDPKPLGWKGYIIGPRESESWHNAWHQFGYSHEEVPESPHVYSKLRERLQMSLETAPVECHCQGPS